MENRQSMSVNFRLIDFNRSIMMKRGFGNELGTHRVAIFWSTKVRVHLRNFFRRIVSRLDFLVVLRFTDKSSQEDRRENVRFL